MKRRQQTLLPYLRWVAIGNGRIFYSTCIYRASRLLRKIFTLQSHILRFLLPVFLSEFPLVRLIYGPLLDKYGRRKTSVYRLVVYLLASWLRFAPTADVLIGIRFLQALGSCAGFVASRALVRDIFPVKKMQKYFL